jgi:hypothetical protein
MKQTKIFKMKFAKRVHISFIIAALLFSVLVPAAVRAQTTPSTTQTCPLDPNTHAKAQCCDGIDNDKDGRADFYGILNADGKTYKTPPDPKCLYREDSEVDVANGSEIIPCTNKCDAESVFELINNAIKFFFNYLLIPIIVIMLVYAGWTYISAQGNPGKKIKLANLLWHIVAGIFLILGAWLIVRVILDALGISQGLIFFQ